jgi:hypothetical protein
MSKPSLFDMTAAIFLAVIAAFEAAIEVQRSLPQSQMMVPITGWLQFVPMALLILVGCLWLCQLFLPARRTIEILAPLADETVPNVREVRGLIWPPSGPLQIFVFADGEWHPQQLPMRDGASWSARCNFGTATAGLNSDFKVAAISRETLVVGSIRRLPWWSTTRSNIVRVTRS